MSANEEIPTHVDVERLDQAALDREQIAGLEQSVQETQPARRPHVWRRQRTTEPLIGRSRTFSWSRGIVAYLGVFAFAAYVINTQVSWGYHSGTFFLSIFFGIIGVMILYFLDRKSVV